MTVTERILSEDAQSFKQEFNSKAQFRGIIDTHNGFRTTITLNAKR
jgi:hypothetical protein